MFLNHYECPRCGHTWSDRWSCMVDDDCGECGKRHISPEDSEDLNEHVETPDLLTAARTVMFCLDSPLEGDVRPLMKQAIRALRQAIATA
jgi:hypothetical protein